MRRTGKIAALWILLCAALPATAHAISATVESAQIPRVVRPGETVAYYRVSFASLNVLPVKLRTLSLTNRTTGPGTVAQRDAELDTLRLYRDDGDGVLELGQDPLVGTTIAAGGNVAFTGLDVTVNGLATTYVHVGGRVSLGARDSDLIDLSLDAAARVTFQPSLIVGGSFPQAPAGSFEVDGLTAAQIALTPVPPNILLAGTTSNLGLNVVLPPNGYQTDQLEKISVVSDGTAAAGADVTAMRAYVDDGDATFEPLADRLLGTMPFTGDRWSLTGLNEAVPLTGKRLFFAYDLSDLAEEGRTVRLRLPAPPEVGVAMASDNDGPIDVAVGNPFFQVASAADRITLTSVVIPPTTVPPGTRAVTLLEVVARNSYSNPRTITGLSVTRAGNGAGTPAQIDQEVEAVTLRADGDGDGVLDDPAIDPVLGNAFFVGGRASFTGLTFALPPGTTTALFVTADVALAATDGDVLSARLSASQDIQFQTSTHVVASWPLDSQALATIDGMVAAQLIAQGGPAVTLGPGDGPVAAFDVIVPRNGYAADRLERIELVNLGSADSSDVAGLRLWRDGGDGELASGGDDVDLGPFTWAGDRWVHATVQDSLVGPGTRYFAGLTVDAAPADSATVRLALPAGGLGVSSGNDGPIDVAVDGSRPLLLSRAPLLATLQIVPSSSALGQPLQVHMIVRNTLAESVNGITPGALVASGNGALAPLSGPVPATLSLAPGQTDTLTWTTSAAGVGTVSLSGSASGVGSPSGQPRTSLAVASAPHAIFASTGQIDVAVSQSLPPSVNRGQDDVVPFTLTLQHPGAGASSPIRVRALRLTLGNGQGSPVVPSALLDEVVVSRGSQELLRKTVLESSGSTIQLTLATPLVLDPQQSAPVAIRLSIAPTTTVPTFQVTLSDPTALTSEDAQTGAPVAPHLLAGTFPVASGVARVVAQATDVEVVVTDSAAVRTGAGRDAVTLLDITLENQGIDGITSDARAFAFGIVLTDSAGAPVPPMADVLERVRVATFVQTVASRIVQASDGSGPVLILNPSVTLPVNTPLTLTISADIADLAAPGVYRLALAAPSSFDVRDANSLAPVTVAFAAVPSTSGLIRIEARAESLYVRGTPRYPAGASIGASGVVAMSVVVRHPGVPPAGRLRFDALTVQCRDQSRRPLVPSTYLDRVSLRWNDVEIASLPDPPSSGGAFTLTLPGATLEPGDSARIEIVTDFAATAPAGFLELMVFGDGVLAQDANLELPAAVAAEPTADPLPLVSGLVRLDPPARDLTAALVSAMPANLAADGREILAGLVSLENTAASGADSIRVDHLRIRASGRSFQPTPVGASLTRLRLFRNGFPVATSDALTPDSIDVIVPFTPPLAVPPDSTATFELRLTTRTDGTEESVRLGFDAAGIGVVQPASALLQVRVNAAPGQVFPVWTEAGTFGAQSLTGSWSNYPNPFAAGRDRTTFAYYLERPARVSIRIFAADGSIVTTLVDRATRDAGLHQSDVWSGLNGEGRTVRNGVYVAELTADWAAGGQERVRRRVAVVR